MVKLRPFMYLKKCEKTFEILRSEITFLMDLYMHIACKKTIMYLILLFIGIGMHYASVLSCSRPSIGQIGGGMHLLIDG